MASIHYLFFCVQYATRAENTAGSAILRFLLAVGSSICPAQTVKRLGCSSQASRTILAAVVICIRTRRFCYCWTPLSRRAGTWPDYRAGKKKIDKIDKKSKKKDKPSQQPGWNKPVRCGKGTSRTVGAARISSLSDALQGLDLCLFFYFFLHLPGFLFASLPSGKTLCAFVPRPPPLMGKLPKARGRAKCSMAQGPKAR